jgi:hypothetical protein
MHRLIVGDPAAALAILRPAADWWRQSSSLHDADVLLLLARAELAQMGVEEAAAAVNEAAAHLEPTDMQRYRLRMLWMRHQVSGDPGSLALARAELEYQSARFTEPGLRAAFLENVSLHRRIAGS